MQLGLQVAWKIFVLGVNLSHAVIDVQVNFSIMIIFVNELNIGTNLPKVKRGWYNHNMNTEQITESERLARQMAAELQAKGEFAKAYSANAILALVYGAARDFAPKAVVGLKLDIAPTSASLSGSITLPDPDVTINIGSLVYTNDPDSKAARLKLAQPAQITDVVREKNLAKLAVYKGVKIVVLKTLDDPQQLLAMGAQHGLDELNCGMRITGIAARVQSNGAIGLKVTGEPKR